MGNGCCISLSLIIWEARNLPPPKRSISDTHNKNSNINLLSTQYIPGPVLGSGNTGIKGMVSAYKCLTMKLENLVIVKVG